MDEYAAVSRSSNEAQAESAVNSDHIKLPKKWDWAQSPTIDQLV